MHRKSHQSMIFRITKVTRNEAGALTESVRGKDQSTGTPVASTRPVAEKEHTKSKIVISLSPHQKKTKPQDSSLEGSSFGLLGETAKTRTESACDNSLLGGLRHAAPTTSKAQKPKVQLPVATENVGT